MINCLIVDDDKKLLQYVSSHLERESIQTHTFTSGEASLDFLENKNVDIAIVDIMMSGMDRDSLSDKERAFLSGTDDYVTKPFEVKELLFRIKAFLRRYQINADNELQLGNLILNQSYMEITVGSKTMNLPNKEFQLLFLLASNPKHIFTRDDIIEKILGFDYEGDDRNVDVHIKRLRQRLSKLKSSVSIQTVRGQGYRMDQNV